MSISEEERASFRKDKKQTEQEVRFVILVEYLADSNVKIFNNFPNKYMDLLGNRKTLLYYHLEKYLLRKELTENFLDMCFKQNIAYIKTYNGNKTVFNNIELSEQSLLKEDTVDSYDFVTNATKNYSGCGCEILNFSGPAFKLNIYSYGSNGEFSLYNRFKDIYEKKDTQWKDLKENEKRLIKIYHKTFNSQQMSFEIKKMKEDIEYKLTRINIELLIISYNNIIKNKTEKHLKPKIISLFTPDTVTELTIPSSDFLETIQINPFEGFFDITRLNEMKKIKRANKNVKIIITDNLKTLCDWEFYQVYKKYKFCENCNEILTDNKSTKRFCTKKECKNDRNRKAAAKFRLELKKNV